MFGNTFLKKIPSFVPIPDRWQKRYFFLRVVLYIIIVSITISFALRALFPIIEQGFNFRTPSSSRNNIVDPRSSDGTLRTNGQVEKGGLLVANTTAAGNFSQANVLVALEKNSRTETLDFSLRRSYRSFLLPAGEVVSTFPTEPLYIIDGTYYALRSDISSSSSVSEQAFLFPFVSEQAFLSRYPKEFALQASTALLTEYPVSEEWLGFRIGSLISNTTGVFVVVNETEIRPIGSAEVFLALGYSFDDVIPADEEEIGIYKRGRIVLLGAPHPDGTIFFDQDTDTHFIIDGGQKRPLAPSVYRDFLLQNIHPITSSSKASEEWVSCSLLPHIFSNSLSCTTSLQGLDSRFGNDFEIHIVSPEKSIDINTLTVSFETAKSKQNMLFLLSQIKQRVLSRFGLGE